jgi:hypothetical protein
VPFAFTGTLQRVEVELATDQQLDAGIQHRAAIAEQ